MPYYIRVLSPRAEIAALGDISTKLSTQQLEANFSVDGPEEAWAQLMVAHPDGNEICVVERNEVEDGSLGEEEIGEFLEDIEDCQPATAVEWLRAYLPTVKTVYAIQVLFGGAEQGKGWDIIGAVKQAILASVGGVIQAGGEGFTNEDGYHILWQFSDSVSGPWWMAVRHNGAWVKFRMELGNPIHRDHFLRGEVPPGIQVRG
jgi:hypothetical protein